LPAVTDFTNHEGLGVQGVVDGHAVLVGRPRLLEQWSVPLPDDLAAVAADEAARGRTTVAVAWDGTARAVFVVADTVKPTPAEAIAEFRRLGLRPVLLTGDTRAVA
ncbi:HAD family hydrolase, partial [Acuticoccus kandeliae]|uniref:HAD family hydrolase n=1 Tax=Acuticoccus kandeliae TaxID=2073160 RepID=UPI000E3D149C